MQHIAQDTPTIIFVGCGDELNFFCKELRFGLHPDSVVQMDFLHVLVSIEFGFIC